MSGESVESFEHPADRRPLDLDLQGIWQAVWRRRNWIIGATATCFALAVAFVLVVKPKYTGEAKVLVENQESYFTRPEKVTADQGQSTAPDQEAVASQVQVITSRDLGREAIKTLGLKGNPYYDPMAGGSGVISSLLSLIGLHGSAAPLSPEDRILENYFDALTVYPVPKSRVLAVEFRAPNPDLAAKGANTIADLYIDLQSRTKREAARAAAASLATLIGELRTKLAQSEANMEAFRASSGLMLGSNNSTLPVQQLSDVNAQLATARATQAEAQAKARVLRDAIRTGRLNEVPDIAKDDLIRRVSEQRITLRGQLALEARTLGPEHPRIKDLHAQLAAVDADLRSSIDKAARALENDARIAGARVDNLQAAVEQQRKTIGNASGDEVRLRELEREVKVYKDQLDSSTTKYQEAMARQESQSTPGDARVISRAIAPQLPSFPKKMPIIVLATLAGFVLSLGAVLMSEFLSGRAYGVADDDGAYESYVAPAALSGMEPGAAKSRLSRDVEPPLDDPHDESQDRTFARDAVMAVRADEASGAGGATQEVFASAARRLLGAAGTDYAIRVLVCCPDAKAASRDTAFPLGRELAVEARTILVDFRHDGRQLRREGLAELLKGDASFEQVIHRDRGSRLHVLERGIGDVEISDDLEVVIDALSQTYEFVVLATTVPEADELTLGLAPAADFAAVVLNQAGQQQAGAELGATLVDSGAGEFLIIKAYGTTPRMRAEARRRESASTDAA